MFKKKDFIILGLILAIAFAARLYKIDIPLADWHSWRQVDTAAVARNYSRDGINMLFPKYDDLSSIGSGIYNPEGYRFVEFPIYNAAIAIFHRFLPILSIEIYGRLITALFSLALISVIYYLVLKEEGRTAAMASALVFSVFPFFVYYSRVVLPDMTALSCVFLSIFFSYKWSLFEKPEKVDTKKSVMQKVFFIVSLVFAMAALLIKPHTVFYFLPLAFIFLRKYRTRVVRRPLPYLFFALSIVPFILWRQWISHYPEGIPGFAWLITTVNTFEGPKVVFFRPAFFRWIFHERILLLIMGGYASLFLVAGALKRPKKGYLLYSIGIASLLYLFTFQGGNVQHDYYQTMILPSLAIFTGIGISLFLTSNKTFVHKSLATPIVGALLFFSMAMSFQTIKGYYEYSSSLVNIGKVIKQITPSDAKIITDRDGDTTLLYLSDRKGFPATIEPLEKLKARGMQYFVTGKADVAKAIQKENPEYKLIFEGQDVFIFKL